MKNKVQYKKEPKIEIFYQGIITTHNLQFALGALFDKSDNANSMGVLNPS